MTSSVALIPGSGRKGHIKRKRAPSVFTCRKALPHHKLHVRGDRGEEGELTHRRLLHQLRRDTETVMQYGIGMWASPPVRKKRRGEKKKKQNQIRHIILTRLLRFIASSNRRGRVSDYTPKINFLLAVTLYQHRGVLCLWWTRVQA